MHSGQQLVVHSSVLHPEGKDLDAAKFLFSIQASGCSPKLYIGIMNFFTVVVVVAAYIKSAKKDFFVLDAEFPR
jgi:hypothetical protein